jgi:hypothetical protein
MAELLAAEGNRCCCPRPIPKPFEAMPQLDREVLIAAARRLRALVVTGESPVSRTNSALRASDSARCKILGAWRQSR